MPEKLSQNQIDQKKSFWDRLFYKNAKKQIETGEKTGHKITYNAVTESEGQIPQIEYIGQFNPDDEPLIKMAVKEISRFLEAPLLEDYFDDDDVKRDDWAKSVKKQHGYKGKEIIEKNRYRPNFIALVYSYIPILAEIFPQIQKIYESITPLPGLFEVEYKRLPKEDKKAVVVQYSRAALEVLQILAQHTTEDNQPGVMEQKAKQPEFIQTLKSLESITSHIDSRLVYKLGNDLREKKESFKKIMDDSVLNKSYLDNESLQQLGIGLSSVNDTIFNLSKLIPFISRVKISFDATDQGNNNQSVSVIGQMKSDLIEMKSLYLQASEPVEKLETLSYLGIDAPAELKKRAVYIGAIRTRFAPDSFASLEKDLEKLAA